MPQIALVKPKKKKLKRVRLLRQDVFKPEGVLEDKKKVTYLARKNSYASKKVLEQIKI